MKDQRITRNIWTNLFIGLLILTYILVMSYFSVKNYLSLHSHYYDLGIMDQVIYNTSRGRILQMTHPDKGINISRFAIHFDPIMIVLAPLYLIKSSPIILLVIQSIILGLGGIAVYLIAKKTLNTRLYALLFVFLYLNYYPLQQTNLFDFHAVIFATTSLLFAFYFFEFSPFETKLRNIVSGLICMAIVFLSKENASLILIFLSGYFFFTKRDKKLFLILGLLNIVLFIVVVFKVIPFFNQEQSFALKYYNFHNPYVLLQRFISKETISYGWKLLYPLGFLSLLSPFQFFISLPELLLNTVSSNVNMRQMYYHYTALITPFVIISAIYGFNNLKKMLLPYSKKIILAVSGLLFILILYSSYHLELPLYLPPEIDNKMLQEIQFWRHRLQNDQIKISATNSIAPFFTERQNFYNFLFDYSYEKLGVTTETILGNMTKYQKADYVVILKRDIDTKESSNIKFLVNQYYSNLKNNSQFKLISDKEGIQVFKKENFY